MMQLCGAKGIELPCDLQKLYFDLYHKVLGAHADSYKKLLNDLEVWDDRDWKNNFKHAVQYLIHSEEDLGKDCSKAFALHQSFLK
jgi:hypothetical protein